MLTQQADVRFDTVDSAVDNEGASETDLGSDITELVNKALTQVLVLTPRSCYNTWLKMLQNTRVACWC